MKAYGIPRDPELDYPDVQIIHEFALKSRANGKRKHDTTRSNFKNSAAKRQTRRRWKRLARQEGKNLCFSQDWS